jgi:hypothetical protein
MAARKARATATADRRMKAKTTVYVLRFLSVIPEGSLLLFLSV